MRELFDHITPGDSVNHQLRIRVTDEPGAGGANHEYDIFIPPNFLQTVLKFQNGPIKEAGVNGVTQEALLAIVIDRLRSFQAGPYACVENGTALEHCEAALASLKFRTEARIRRGVEGTHQK